MCSNNFCVASASTSCSGSDAAVRDSRVAVDAEVLGPWSSPTLMDIAPPIGNDDDPTLSANPHDHNNNRHEPNFRGSHIFRSVRASTTVQWPAPSDVTEVNSTSQDGSPKLSNDGTLLFQSSNRTPSADYDIWVSDRSSPSVVWNSPAPAPDLNSSGVDGAATISNDYLTIVFYSTRGGDSDLYISERSSPTVAFGIPTPLTTLNMSGFQEESPVLSANKLTIYFNSNRTGNHDLYVATRNTTSEAFGAPQRITELSDTTLADTDPWLSPDGHHIYFARVASGGFSSLYEAVR
jgi:hypothetical protein